MILGKGKTKTNVSPRGKGARKDKREFVKTFARKGRRQEDKAAIKEQI